MTPDSFMQPAMWSLLAVLALALARLAWRRARARRPVRPYLLALGGCALLAVVVVPALAWVPAGHRGVVYRWGGGIDQAERGEGLTLIAPWLEDLRLVSVRTRKVFSDKVFSQSADLQEITVVASVNYHVDPTRAAELYQEVGPRFEQTVIQPALFQRVKAAVGQVRAEDFALERGRLAATIERQLTDQLATYGLVVEFVNIEDAIFDPDFVQAVKDKVIAEQKAQEQRRLVAAKQAEAQQAIATAQGEAAAIRITAEGQARANERLAKSITPTLLRWQWLSKWDGVLPKVLLGGGAPVGVLLQPPLEEDATAPYFYGGE